MDPIYAEAINSFSNDLDNLWKNKNAFSSVKSSKSISIEDGNYCSYNTFMLSSSRGLQDDTGINNSNFRQGSRDLRAMGTQSMPLIERLAKTAAIWTLPDLSRSEADKILQAFTPGIFIVRMTTDKRSMVLSYRMADRTQHVMIKVNVKKGFYMDGSEHVFNNVNHMIAHYMKYPVYNPNLLLKLPRALMEAHEAVHFQFFENMKINFWTTLLASKSINEIWSKPIHDTRTVEKMNEKDVENCPPVPPRGYNSKELNIIQGQADVYNLEDDYQKIVSKSRLKLQNPPPPPPSSPPKTSHIIEKECIKEEGDYSHIWKWESEKAVAVTGEETQKKEKLQTFNGTVRKGTNFHSMPSRQETISPDFHTHFTIPKIIEKFYPQLIFHGMQLPDTSSPFPSLKENILQKCQEKIEDSIKQPKCNTYDKETDSSEPIYVGPYETPWDIKNNWISKLMDMENRDVDIQNNLMNEFIKVGSDANINSSRLCSLPPLPQRDSIPDLTDVDSNKELTCRSESEDEEEELKDDENRLQVEFLKEIEPVMFSPSTTSEIYITYKTQFGQSIRNFLSKLCSRDGTSDISKSVNLFVSCTIERSDLSPYTTMRLIRQYMSGLKNLITKNKNRYSLDVIIDEEIKHTPKNVFINLDSIIESVLTKSVLKLLNGHVYKLLVLEHYKNNNLKQIADGVETSKLKSIETLGLTKDMKCVLDSKIGSIRQKFSLISKQYSPESKIKYMISIVDIVLNMLKIIYPKTEVDNMETDIKSENVLPLFVYIFSQCKVDAMATQCEVEYVEGLIWSSKLVNGEPGFFLLNLMSALEAIKVLSRPKLDNSGVIDLSNKSSTTINNSSFYTKINPSSLSNAAVGSVNVIIMDEKINRLVTKTFPVRSTITVNSLCNTIAHRLGIFNPNDYSLYKYTGFDEFLLQDHECPLVIKQSFQQQTGESVNFLFRRKNANFIIPSDIR